MRWSSIVAVAAEQGILEGHVHGAAGQKFAERPKGRISLLTLGGNGDARDNLIEIVAIESSPQLLLFVEDEELAGGALIERLHRVGQRGLLGEELGGHGIEKRRERLAVQERSWLAADGARDRRIVA